MQIQSGRTVPLKIFDLCFLLKFKILNLIVQNYVEGLIEPEYFFNFTIGAWKSRDSLSLYVLQHTLDQPVDLLLDQYGGPTADSTDEHSGKPKENPLPPAPHDRKRLR
jgi:hypothetical protein